VDIDSGLLGAVCRDGMSAFLDQGVTEDMLVGSAQVAFRFIEEHWKEYKNVPTAETVFQETGLSVQNGPVEPLKFWSDQIKRRYLYETLRADLSRVADHMEERDPEKALAEIEALLFRARSQVVLSNRPVGLFSDPDAIMADYELAKQGLTGVPSPWPSINKITRGWQPGDFAIITARPSVGKTFLLLLALIWAWRHGHKVLLGSTEMSQQSMRRRVAALICGLSYARTRDGELTSQEEDILRTEVYKLKDDNRFLIMGDGFDVTLNSLEAAVIETQPTIVGADGAYLFRCAAKYKDKNQNMAELFNGFKQLAKRNNVPIIGTTQLNRGDKKASGPVGLDRLAFSDNAGMVSDWVFSIQQTKEMRANRELEIRPIKTRESEFTGNIKINWDFSTQNFTEKLDDEKSMAGVMKTLDNMEFADMDSEEEVPF